MSEQGSVFKSPEDLICARLIKEEYCEIKSEEEMDMDNNDYIRTNYRSSNEQMYGIRTEPFVSAAQLFQMVDCEYKGKHQIITIH